MFSSIHGLYPLEARPLSSVVTNKNVPRPWYKFAGWELLLCSALLLRFFWRWGLSGIVI